MFSFSTIRNFRSAGIANPAFCAMTCGGQATVSVRRWPSSSHITASIATACCALARKPPSLTSAATIAL